MQVNGSSTEVHGGLRKLLRKKTEASRADTKVYGNNDWSITRAHGSARTFTDIYRRFYGRKQKHIMDVHGDLRKLLEKGNRSLTDYTQGYGSSHGKNGGSQNFTDIYGHLQKHLRKKMVVSWTSMGVYGN